MTLGKRIKEVRGKVARPAFAASFGLSRNTIQRYETDEGPPDTNFVIALCEKYKIRVEWLLFGEEPKYLGEPPKVPLAELDRSILTDAIEALEFALQEKGRKIEAATKAEIITELYLLMSEEEQSDNKSNIAKILRLVA